MPFRLLLTMHKFSQGGADRVAILLANGFASAGNDTAIALMMSGGEGEAILAPLRDQAVTLGAGGPRLGSRKLELARGLPFLLRRIRLQRPDVVVAMSNNVGLITALASILVKRRGIRFAFKTTNPVIRPRDRTKLARWYRRWLYDFIFMRFDSVLTLTEAEREQLSLLYPRHAGRFLTVLNPYVSEEMLAEFERETPARNASRTIIALARFMPQKRLDLLVTAFARMKRRQDRLIILGEGPERPAIEALCVELSVADRVEMPGFVADVVPWLRKADLFALSSQYEGLPAAVIEALATNCPVVTTDCFHGAATMLASAPYCSVVAKGDADAFATAMDRGLDYDVRPADLHQIARRYDMQSAVESHLAALTSLAIAAHAERSDGVAADNL